MCRIRTHTVKIRQRRRDKVGTWWWETYAVEAASMEDALKYGVERAQQDQYETSGVMVVSPNHEFEIDG